MSFNRSRGSLVVSRVTNKTSFKQVQDYVRDQHKKLCSTTVNSDFALQSTQDADYIVVIGNSKNRSMRSGKKHFNFSTTMGFANVKLLKQTNFKNAIYVDLICGAGFGGIMFEVLEDLARKLKKSRIVLSAIPEAMMQYYHAYGFKFSDSCDEIANITRIAESTYLNSKKLIGETKLLNKEINKRERILSASEKKSIQYKQLTKDLRNLEKEKKTKINQFKRATFELEKMLVGYELVSEKGCGSPKKCGVNGYTMTKCLS